MSFGQTDHDGKRYNVLTCTTCGELRFIVEKKEGGFGGDHWFSEVVSYPVQPFVTRPSWLDRLDDELRKMMESVYTALDHRLFFLASIGVRTALDRVICEKIGDTGTFKEKMKVLRERGYVDDSNNEILDALIEAGNASAHRGYGPDDDTAKGIIELAEHIIHKVVFEKTNLAALVTKAKKIKKETPKKKQTQSSAVKAPASRPRGAKPSRQS